LRSDHPKIFNRSFLIIILLAAVKLLIPLIIHPDFEFHRDEFLYMAMGNHLALGYLEVPPFIALVSKLTALILGKSLYAMRFLPAVSGAVTVIVIGLIVRELGGRFFAQILAILAYLFSIVYLRMNLFLMPVTFDLMFFVLGSYLFIRILKKNQPRLWVWLGVVTGFGLLNKYTMLLFAFGILIGLLLSSHRTLLLQKWPYLSALIALLIWLPNLIWQQQNGWPFFDHMRVLAESQLSHMNPGIFLLAQLLMNFYAAPIWIIGLYSLLAGRLSRDFRPVGWLYVSILLVMLILNGKIYYLAPAYPMLLAAGAVSVEAYILRHQRYWLKPAILSLMLMGYISLIPVGLPVLSTSGLIGYFRFASKYMGVGDALRWESGELHQLPQDYADMLGWKEMTEHVAQVYHSLPPAIREKCAIVTANYGEAGAIDYYAEQFDIPRCISKGGSFWGWGYREYDGECAVTVGFSEANVRGYYNIVEPAAPFQYPFARESGISVLVVKEPRIPLSELWAILKEYRW
jgi:hypothetical protein